MCQAVSSLRGHIHLAVLAPEPLPALPISGHVCTVTSASRSSLPLVARATGCHQGVTVSPVP